MQQITQAILQLGFAPALAGYLLFDYSKKLTAIQMEMLKTTIISTEQQRNQEELLHRLERIERKIDKLCQ